MKIPYLRWERVVITYEHPIDEHYTKSDIFEDALVSFDAKAKTLLIRNDPRETGVLLSDPELIFLDHQNAVWNAIWWRHLEPSRKVQTIKAMVTCKF